MKLDARRTGELLRNPERWRAVLLHGEDLGLIRERAETLVRLVAGQLDDPFRVTQLDRDELSRIPEEMSALALTGGRRVIRVRDASDSATSVVQRALAGPGEALLILEGPGLTGRSTLRAALDRAADAATVACYAEEGAGLVQTIRDGLGATGVSSDSETLSWLAGQLGADRGGTRNEIEKLALYAGAGGRIDLAAAAACVGDLAGLSLEDALFAATAGDVPGTDRALELAMAEGAAPVAVLRTLLAHLHRLQRARAAMRDGVGADEAARGVKPPVFFKRVGAFAAALGLWPEAALHGACDAVWEAERACKRTGAPAETICCNIVLTIARRAAMARRRSPVSG